MLTETQGETQGKTKLVETLLLVFHKYMKLVMRANAVHFTLHFFFYKYLTPEVTLTDFFSLSKANPGNDLSETLYPPSKISSP